VQIADRKIGTNFNPLIIAELGINHGGDYNLAERMVKIAFENGCEAIKHQTHILEDEMTDEAKKIIPPNADISIWHIMEKCSLSKEEEVNLKKFTEGLGMLYLSTPFSRSAADFLAEINIPAFKIGSGECDNLPLIEHIASLGKPVILSTGMQTASSIQKPIDIIERHKIDYAILECTNIYPCPPEEISLGSITDFYSKFPNAEIGFSDHSIGPEMALAAIAMGATIVEKHFTDTKDREGPDISCSMDPAELNYLINKGIDIARARDRKKFIANVEKEVYKFARSSLVADSQITKGSLFTKDNLWARRPGNGEIPGYQYEKILGKIAKNNINKNQQLKWSDIG
jgi:N-acetylneuraminate synthase